MGYAGGTKANPTYRSLGDHTESVEIDYDPSRISYEDLLKVFWTGHDASHRSWSRQYASLILVRDADQRKAAEASKARIERERGRPVATEILDYRGFTLAEDYHQKHSLRRFPDFEAAFSRIYPSPKDLIASTAAARVNGYLGAEGSFETLEREISDLGLSPELQQELIRIAGRGRSKASCPLPAGP